MTAPGLGTGPGLAGLMSRTLSYALALVSLVISALLYLEVIGDKLSGARIPQDIDTPCSLFFLALALIFLALGLAERPASGEPWVPPPSADGPSEEDDPEPELEPEPQNHK